MIRMILAVALVLFVTVACSHSKLTPLLGSWVVVAARVDTSGVHAWQRDDPALLGSVLSVSPELMTLRNYTCEMPELDEHRANINDLILRTFDVNASRMGITEQVAADRPVAVLRCATGQIGPSLSRDTPWFFQFASDQLWLSWFDGVLLMFRRELPK